MDWSWSNVAGENKRTWPDRTPIERVLPSGTPFDRGALSPDRSRAITVHHDGAQGGLTIQLWNASAGRRLGKALQADYLNFAGFSPDSRHLVVAGTNPEARLIDAETGEAVGGPLAHDAPVVYAAFSPDGALLVTCSEDQTARLWWTKTGLQAGEKLRHGGIVTTAAFSPNGQTLATGSLDGTLRVWDVGRQVLVGVQELNHDFARELRFHPNGLFLLAAVSEKLRIWDVVSLQDITPAVRGYPVLGGIGLGLSFERDGRVAIGFRFGRAESNTYDLEPDTRPVRDLVKLGQLYSGRSWDAAGGAIPLRRQELESLWRELRDKHPEEFTVSAKAALDWRAALDWQAALGWRLVPQGSTDPTLRWLGAALGEADWQPGERGNEDLDLLDYFRRLAALALWGRHAEAVAAAEAHAERWPKDSYRLDLCAHVYALATRATKDSPLAARYATRAVALLRQAAAAGLRADQRKQLREDPDLDALRGRHDFRELLKMVDTKHP
jgi:WD40 repeat protein